MALFGFLWSPRTGFLCVIPGLVMLMAPTHKCQCTTAGKVLGSVIVG